MLASVCVCAMGGGGYRTCVSKVLGAAATLVAKAGTAFTTRSYHGERRVPHTSLSSVDDVLASLTNMHKVIRL